MNLTNERKKTKKGTQQEVKNVANCKAEVSLNIFCG
jgi:hypothetical protein